MHVRFRQQFRLHVCRGRISPGWGQVGIVPETRALQGFVDFSLRENPVKALIPEFKDPGGAVCVAEIRVGVVNAGVDDGSDDTGTIEIVSFWICLRSILVPCSI